MDRKPIVSKQHSDLDPTNHIRWAYQETQPDQQINIDKNLLKKRLEWHHESIILPVMGFGTWDKAGKMGRNKIWHLVWWEFG
jgi:hypothetical protein